MNNPNTAPTEKDEANNVAPLETWTPPQLQRLPVSSTAASGGSSGSDGFTFTS